MTATVVITYGGFDEMALERQVLQEIDATMIFPGPLETPDALAAVIRADALMVTLQPVRADLVNRLERCRIISRAGTGLDTIDIPAATARGIWVTNVPDYSIDEVSNHAIALLLARARRLLPLIESTRQGHWSHHPAVPGHRLKDQTLGVLGFGRIGRATAGKGQGLGMRVIVHDPFVSPQVVEAAGLEVVSWETLLATADYITLHVPLAESTRHMVDAQALSRMKPTAYLINAARGPLIDEDALLHAVQSGVIAGAALDVLSVEPPPPNHPLLHTENILVTPHSAWYSEEAMVEMRVRAAEEVVRVLRGERPRCPVNQVDLTSARRPN